MDTLSDLLKSIRLESAVYFEKQFHGDWGMKMDNSPYGQFHFVTRGRCTVILTSSQNEIEMSAGDVILFPFGIAHSISENASCESIPGMDVYNAHLNHQNIFHEGSEKATLICGHYSFTKDYAHPLIQSLPEYIHIRSNQNESKSIQKIIFDISSEMNSEKPGSNSIIHRLAEVLFIQIIRYYSLLDKEIPAYFRAINDIHISKVLSSMHASIENDWGLDELSKIAGLSRTAFVNRFSEFVGSTPIQYLTKIRLLKAKDLLASTNLAIIEISTQVGYGSEAAFSRAFKREFNQSPSELRK